MLQLPWRDNLLCYDNAICGSLDVLQDQFFHGAPVFALRFQNLPARNSSLKIFKHEKEEKLAGLKGKLAGPAQFLVAKGLGPALSAKTGAQ